MVASWVLLLVSAWPAAAVCGAPVAGLDAVHNLAWHVGNMMLHSALLRIASQEERKQRAKMQGLQPHQVPGAEGLSVRVVNSVLKKCETRPRFVDAFSGADGYPADFPYRQRVVVLFQVCVWRGVWRVPVLGQRAASEGGSQDCRLARTWADAVRVWLVTMPATMTASHGCPAQSRPLYP